MWPNHPLYGCPTPSTSLPATCSSAPTGHTSAAPITSTDVTVAATRTVLAGVLSTAVLSTGLMAVSVPPAPADPSGSSLARSAYVAVSVATVWTTPQSPRPVDHPALSNPVDIRGWLSDMTPAQQEALTSDNLTQTQALFGDRVFVVGEQGDWDEVVVPGQPTPKNAQGYPGWIPKAQLTTEPGYGALKDHGSFALADRGVTTWLYRDSGLFDHDLEISTNTGLPVLNRTDTAVRVATPDRDARWLDARAVTVYQKPTDKRHP